jgi:TolB-like protein
MPPIDEQFWVLAGLGFVALALAVIVRALMVGRPAPLPVDGPLRLVVRPLRELKPDPNHLYLGSTIARDIAAALKRFERLDSSVGDGASGLSLDGTVRKTGPRLVMNVRLLSGHHAIWRGTYDSAIADLARLEDEIVVNVARTLRVAPRAQSQKPSAEPA